MSVSRGEGALTMRTSSAHGRRPARRTGATLLPGPETESGELGGEVELPESSKYPRASPERLWSQSWRAAKTRLADALIGAGCAFVYCAG